MKKPRILFLVGPTAIGKTEISVVLAKKINAEIISCDSMQVYKGMDIITSKLPKYKRNRVTHHLIDTISPAKEYNVSRYRKNATKVLKDIINRGKIPFFVGGTGLYMSVLIDGIFETKAQDNVLRKKLYEKAKLEGSNYLYNRLKKVDSEAAAKIHPNDIKRIIRALEVFKITGKRISELQKLKTGLIEDYNITIFGLNMDREKLYRKINERVDGMFRKGIVGEVKGLLGKRLSKTASSAIGIKELKSYFEGYYDLSQAKGLIQKNTRNYAKRQLTWFRKNKRIHWINLGEKEKSILIANKILKLWKKRC